jgi:hypothetical protein
MLNASVLAPFISEILGSRAQKKAPRVAGLFRALQARND